MRVYKRVKSYCVIKVNRVQLTDVIVITHRRKDDMMVSINTMINQVTKKNTTTIRAVTVMTRTAMMSTT